jgi:VanZ family protein
MASIFYFSSQPAEVSAGLSNNFISLIFSRVWPVYNTLSNADKVALWSEWSHIVRKAGHFCEFALLGFFLYAAIRVSRFKKIKIGEIGASLITGLVYAACDEFHQLFVPGRSAQIDDVFLDFSGAVLGVALCALAFAAFHLLRRVFL